MRNTPSFAPFPQAVALLATTSLILTTFSLYPSWTAHAFLPNAALKNVNNTPNSCSHENITKDLINEYDKVLFGLGSRDLTNDMKAARDKISDANVAVDSRFSLNNRTSTVTFNSAEHFDAENFQGGQKLLIDKKMAIRAALLSPRPEANSLNTAREALGQALHTLQDFYSHSNWVELRNTVHPALGVVGRRMGNPPMTTRTGTDCSREDCDDCYDPNRTPPLNNVTTTALTSGYYRSEVDLRLFGINLGRYNIVEDRKKPNQFKCSHGGKARANLGVALGIKEFTDLSGAGAISNGINKDADNCTISPHFDRHFDAARLAKLATKKYLDEIKRVVGVPKMKLNTEPVVDQNR